MGQNHIILKDVFSKYSQQLPKEKKHFSQFTLSNTAVTELEANVFSDIIFDMIVINNASKLTSIDSNAFKGSEATIKAIYIENTPLVSDQQNNDIFGIFSKFSNLESLTIDNSRVEVIPSLAFRPLNGYQNKLKFIKISGSLRKVMNNAFYNLNSLSYLNIGNNSIDILQSEALKFRTSEQYIGIVLDCNLFNASNVEENAYKNINRPVLLYDENEFCWLTYFDEKIFGPFFDNNSFNRIKAHDSASHIAIDCDDCRSVWLLKEEYLNRIDGLICNNGRNINDASSFTNCKHN